MKNPQILVGDKNLNVERNQSWRKYLEALSLGRK